MKRIIALLLVAVMIFSLCACGKKKVDRKDPETQGEAVKYAFEDAVADSKDVSTIAKKIAKCKDIKVSVEAMPVEAGWLAGFDGEITGFKEAATVQNPMMGGQPFFCYVFKMEKAADAQAFLETLQKNANPRWCVCTETDETVYEIVDDIVFFCMDVAKPEE